MSYVRAGLGDAAGAYDCLKMCARVWPPATHSVDYARCTVGCAPIVTMPATPIPAPKPAPGQPGAPPAADGPPWLLIGAGAAALWMLTRRRR